MVDPVSSALGALGAASAILDLGTFAWKVGNTLYQLHQNSKGVDKSIGDLAAEVKVLAGVCDLVHQELQCVIQGPDEGNGRYDKDGRLWRSTRSQIEECSHTLEELDQIAQGLLVGERGYLAQVGRQIKLNNAKERIAGAKDRVRSHTNVLQIVLSVINVKVAHLAPGFANQELISKIDELQRKTQVLQDTLDSPSKLDDQSAATLVECAKDAIASGKTLYEESLAGGSIMGGPLAAASNVKVAEWVLTLDSLRQDAHSSSYFDDLRSRAQTVFSMDDNSSSGVGTTAGLPDFAGEPIEYDLDDEFAVDIAQAALDEGRKAYEKQQWTVADSYLKESLVLVKQLPVKQRCICDVSELQYKLAVCAYHTKDYTVAEGALSSLVQQPAESDEQRLRVCDAGHLLARLYIVMGRIEAARMSCESTLKGRSKLLGKEHESYFESLALLSSIYRSMGKPARADIFFSLIPEGRRETYQALAGLTIETTGGAPSTSSERSDPDENAARGQELDVPLRLSRTGGSSVSEASIVDRSPVIASIPAAGASKQLTPAVMTTTNYLGSLGHSTPPHERRSEGRSTKSEVTLPELQKSPDKDLYNVWESLYPYEPLNGPMGPSLLNPLDEVQAQDTLLVASASNTSGHHEAYRNAHVHQSTPNRTQQAGKQNRSAKSVTLNSSPWDAATRKWWVEKLNITPRSELERSLCADRIDLAMGRIKSSSPGHDTLSGRYLQPPPPSALHFAALFGDLDVAEALVQRGNDINHVARILQRPVTPLSLAIKARQVWMVRFLLAEGATVSHDKNICSELLMCLEWQPAPGLHQLTTIVDLLIQAGVDINFMCGPLDDGPDDRLLPREDRVLPLLWQVLYLPKAQMHLQRALVDLLLARGAKVTAGERAPGRTQALEDFRHPERSALLVAVSNDANHLVPPILAQLTTQQVSESRALLEAVERAIHHPNLSLGIVKNLLKAGASIHGLHPKTRKRFMRSSELKNVSPLEVARGSSRKELIAMLDRYQYKGVPKKLSQ